MNPNNKVFQFKISLLDTNPQIWRRIQVPLKYSFWDLHTAIQDAMGWFDSHLHEFGVKRPHSRKLIRIGLPFEDELEESEPLFPGWETPLVNYVDVGTLLQYKYDFGDNWRHEILCEGILLKTKGMRYPICLDGEGACPPEDCGGIDGFYQLLEIIADRSHPEYDEMMEWLGHPYDPFEFDPGLVTFDNPKKRLSYVLNNF